MQVPFSTLPPTAKVWVFQSDRKFSPEQRTIIERHLQLFTQNWAAHGVPLSCSFEIRYDQFVILGVDEQQQMASGCSIDTAVREIQALGQAAGINFFDRTKTAFLHPEGVRILPMEALKKAFEAGEITATTLYFNNAVTSKEALEKQWILPASAGWVKRYLPVSLHA